jgi:hypothetical protein
MAACLAQNSSKNKPRGTFLQPSSHTPFCVGFPSESIPQEGVSIGRRHFNSNRKNLTFAT